jgi:hypothetical protein
MILISYTNQGQKLYLSGFYASLSPCWSTTELGAIDYGLGFLKVIAEDKLKLERYQIRERLGKSFYFIQA